MKSAKRTPDTIDIASIKATAKLVARQEMRNDIVAGSASSVCFSDGEIIEGGTLL